MQKDDYVLYRRMWLRKGNSAEFDKLTDRDMRRVLRRGGGILVRNVYDFDTSAPTSFWYVIKDRFNGMDELAPKTRWMVRRALKTLEIRRIDKAELVEAGAWEVFCRAFDHYKVKEGHIGDRGVFERGLLEMNDRTECWAAFDRQTGRLAAYAVNDVDSISCGYASIKADPEYLKWYYPIYGLIYEMNRHYLDERRLRYVSDGARSSTEHSNIQPWLEEKFGFRKAYCRLQVCCVWWLKIVIGVLYPFRRRIGNRRMCALLRLEEMRRGAS